MTLSTLKWPALMTAVTLVAFFTAGRTPLYGAEGAVSLPPPAVDNPKQAGAPQTAVLAAGCFWGVQGVFEHVRGVRKVVAGYAGGERSTAQYYAASTGATGHAESVMITFDPAQISYGQLLQIAFSVVHDPTQLNRQGPDSGSQYRSAIFYANADQQRIAESYIAQLNEAHAFSRPIATRLEPLKGFYPRGGLPPGLSGEPSQRAVHRVQRYAQGPEPNLERVFPALYNPPGRAHDLEIARLSEVRALEQLRHQSVEASGILLVEAIGPGAVEDRARPRARPIESAEPRSPSARRHRMRCVRGKDCTSGRPGSHVAPQRCRTRLCPSRCARTRRCPGKVRARAPQCRRK